MRTGGNSSVTVISVPRPGTAPGGRGPMSGMEGGEEAMGQEAEEGEPL